jgi:hypothetical protein
MHDGSEELSLFSKAGKKTRIGQGLWGGKVGEWCRNMHVENT